MDWGPIPVGEHDSGTDFFVQIRGDDLSELGLLLGVQVKNEKAYFTSSQKRAAHARGYWEYQASQADVMAWLDHSVPHILALYDRDQRVAYWGHVTFESVRWTEKGARIAIPCDNVLGEATRPQLATIAAEPRRRFVWSGASWTSITSVTPSRRLRTALLTPRIAAPHPNQGVERLEPEAAIAQLMLGRFPSLAPHHEGMPSEEEQKSGSFGWRLHHAFWAYLTTGDLALLKVVAGIAEAEHERAAACAIIAAVSLEEGRVSEALHALDQVNYRDLTDPVDQAWMDSLRARCLYESSANEEARDLALKVAAVGLIHSHDPTAVALRSASLNNTLIHLGADWSNFDQVVIANDSPPVWWRDQHRAWALEEVLDRSFEEWSGARKPDQSTDSETWSSLRGLALSTGIAGDHRGWRRSASALARYEMASAAQLATDRLKGCLTDLRVAGDKDAVRQAAERVIRLGPIDALRGATDEIDLDTCTPTSLTSSLELLSASMDVMSDVACERGLAWVLGHLQDPSALPDTGQGSYWLISDVLVPFVRRAYRHVGGDSQERIRRWLCEMPAIANQGLAEQYAKLAKSIPQVDWTESELSSITHRAGTLAPEPKDPDQELTAFGDHRSLGRSFNAILAQTVDERRKDQLTALVVEGDWQTLAELGSIRDVPEAVLSAAIPYLVEDLERRGREAALGRAALGGIYSGEVLIIINWIHPEIARWDPIEKVLAGEGSDWDQASLATKLADAADHLDEKVVGRLLPHIEELAATEDDHPLFSARLGESARMALLALRGVLNEGAELQARLASGAAGRCAVAREIGRRGTTEHLPLLMSLATDVDHVVRAAAATACAKWLQREPLPEVTSLVSTLLDSGGYSNAYAVMRGIDHVCPNEEVEGLLNRLTSHESGAIRRRAAQLIEHPTLCTC